jgi:hypothetical protein
VERVSAVRQAVRVPTTAGIVANGLLNDIGKHLQDKYMVRGDGFPDLHSNSTKRNY